MKTIMVVDGQGGGIGRLIVEKLTKAGLPLSVFACGTNSAATSAMLKGGAAEGATGENAIVYNAASADFIAGPVGIISANAMLGEISPAIAAAVASSSAPKLLIPLNRCNLYIAGADSVGPAAAIDELIEKLKTLL